jgi:hypothetical protein
MSGIGPSRRAWTALCHRLPAKLGGLRDHGSLAVGHIPDGSDDIGRLHVLDQLATEQQLDVPLDPARLEAEGADLPRASLPATISFPAASLYKRRGVRPRWLSWHGRKRSASFAT